MKQFLKRYIRNNLIVVDIAINTLLCGDYNETMSSRLGKAHRGDFGVIGYRASLIPYCLVNTLMMPFEGMKWGHCERSIQEDEGKYDLLTYG